MAEVKKSDSVPTTAHTLSTFDIADLDIGNKRLGKGGSGDVYEGNWKQKPAEKFAVKVVRSSHSEMLEREIQVWSSLPSHPNIIPFLGVAYTKLNTFLVSELATNGSLYDYIHVEKKAPSVNQSLTWASHIAHGMKHLHDHEVIHRDLKSHNVLLTGEWVAKLCDFGTARKMKTNTTTTDQVGTYRWMSPEVMRTTTARVSKKCDLFSYGMILFELFSHEIPYPDLDGKYQVSESVMAGKRPPIPPTLPSYLHDLIRRCWEEDPHQRPTFDDFGTVFAKKVT